ncbi:MAG: hypothetical protein ACPGVP_11705 [Thiolinea sp.]
MTKRLNPAMFRYVKILVISVLLSGVAGCSSLVAYFENFEKGLQKQNVDELERRSVYFRPHYNLKQPKREALTPREQKLVGAPPPPKGVVLLDGTRYYSANGHVCHLFKDTRYQSPVGTKSACYIKGRWVLAAPVLNTRQAKP